MIKKMPTDYLHLHYIIYRSLNKLMIANPQKKSINVALDKSIAANKINFSHAELIKFLSNDAIATLHGLLSLGLINEFKTGIFDIYDSNNLLQATPYVMVAPTPLGIQLFAIANNDFDSWREFNTVDFGDFKDIELPEHYAPTDAGLAHEIFSAS